MTEARRLFDDAGMVDEDVPPVSPGTNEGRPGGQAGDVPGTPDLRDYPYMPLDVVRLRDSTLAATATGEEFRAAVLLWCASWHQIPAGTLPSDDRVLAHLAGFGRDLDAWREVKEGALHGFKPREDGRIAHPLIVAKALIAWEEKVGRVARRQAERAKKQRQRGISDTCPANVPGDKSGTSPGTNEGRPGGQGGDVPPLSPNIKGKVKVEVKGSGSPPPSGAPPPDTARGSRLPDDWRLTDELRQFGLDAGLSPERVDLEADKFRDYWRAKPTKDARRVDWTATWRNWIRRAMEDFDANRPRGSTGGAGSSARDRTWAKAGLTP